MTSRLIISLFLTCTSLITFSQSIDKEKLDAYFKALEDNNKFMGSVAVAKDGQLLYTKSIGYIDAKNKIRADKNSKYRIGSISKTFTAVMTFMAVEKGLLDLNQTIEKYFPSIANAGKITISDLLYHRTGIHDFTQDVGYTSWLTQAKLKNEMIGLISKGGSDFEPGSKAQYSNSNYVLLSYILEDVFHMPYPKMIKLKIIDPLSLPNTYYGSRINHEKNECASYSYMTSWEKETETNMTIPMGAGGIISTPSDLVKFSEALFSGKIISEKSLAQMTTLKDDYGMGLYRVPFDDKTGYGHTGGIDGFSSSFFYFPQDKVSFALTSNGSNFNNNDIAIAVLSAVYQKPFDIPVFTTHAIAGDELEPFLGTYSSTQLFLKIKITRDGDTLIAQATDQPSFPLVATGPARFTFDQAGVVMEFNVEEKTLLLKQAGEEFLFKKEWRKP